MRLIDSCRLKDLLGPVTRVKKKRDTLVFGGVRPGVNGAKIPLHGYLAHKKHPPSRTLQ